MLVEEKHRIDASFGDFKVGNMGEKVISNEKTHENEVIDDSF